MMKKDIQGQRDKIGISNYNEVPLTSMANLHKCFHMFDSVDFLSGLCGPAQSDLD